MLRFSQIQRLQLHRGCIAKDLAIRLLLRSRREKRVRLPDLAFISKRARDEAVLPRSVSLAALGYPMQVILPACVQRRVGSTKTMAQRRQSHRPKEVMTHTAHARHVKIVRGVDSFMCAVQQHSSRIGSVAGSLSFKRHLGEKHGNRNSTRSDVARTQGSIQR